MSRGARIPGLMLALLLVACDVTPPQGVELLDRADGTRVGADVLESVRRDGGVRVVIALEAPLLTGRWTAPGTLEGMSQAVASVADRVLGRVTADEFQLAHRYAVVPALAGTLRTEAALARLAADPSVRRIDLDVGGTGALGSSVAQINADRRHQRGNTGAGVTVAILDTGIDAAHPELAGSLTHEACFGANSGNGFCHNGGARHTGPGAARDDAGHGTHVTGIAASRGVAAAPGVAPAASIVAIKVLDNCSFSGCFSFFSEIVAALDHIIANHATLGVRVINMSLGTTALFSGVCDQTTAYNMAGSAAMEALVDLGVVAFASTMNNGSATQMASPACLENVVAVGAVNGLDAVAAFSNSNEHTDILAPGVSISSLAIGGGVRSVSGTSMASPHAAGCAALLIQSGAATNHASITHWLRATGVPVMDPKNGLIQPRIDCAPEPLGPPHPRATVPVDRPGD